MTRQSKVATKPIALPELPSRQFYTLVEAAAELNRVYSRSDVDENYILQLASMGKIAVQWLFNEQKNDLFFVPQKISRRLIDDFRWSEIQHDCTYFKSLRLGEIFIDIGTFGLQELILNDFIDSSSLHLINIFYLLANTSVVNETLKEHVRFTILNLKNYPYKRNATEKYVYGSIKEKKIFQNELRPDKVIEGDTTLFVNFDDSLFDEDIIANYRESFAIRKTDLYVLKYDIDRIKNGSFRDRETYSRLINDKHLPSLIDQTALQPIQERPSDQRRQVLTALRNMAKCNTSQPYKDAEVLLAYAESKGLNMPANIKTIAKHIYPDQDIDND